MPVFTKLETGAELGSGVHRHAHDLTGGKLVIKFAHDSDRARMANLLEHAVWNTVKGTQFEELFVPILACHSKGEWVIMPKVTTLWGWNGERNSRVNDYYDKVDRLRNLGMGDLHEYNMTPDGRVLDYGISNYDTPAEVKAGIKQRMSRGKR